MGRREDERAAFERALAEDPRDETTHRVFADWLDEFGGLPDDPERASLHRGWDEFEYDRALGVLGEFAAAFSEPENSYERSVARPVSVEKLLLVARNILRGVGEDDMVYLPFDTPDIAYDRRGDFWEAVQAATCEPVPDDRRSETFVRCGC